MAEAIKGRIMIVDDEPLVRRALARLVGHFGHECETVESGEKALETLHPEIDLMLLDAMLPGIKGYEVLRRLRKDERWATLPVIMLTAHADRKRRLEAARAGANDFLTKPVDIVSLQVRTDSLLRMKAAQDEVKAQKAQLEQLVERRTADLKSALEQVRQTRDTLRESSYDTIRTLAAAAEYRDECTAQHVERVGVFCGMMAARLGLPAERVELIEKAAQLHDVGKIGVPDSILLKKGRFTPQERRIMEQHTIIGGRILGDARSEVLKLARIIAMTHHEWWDGSGYPRGLKGEQIPLEGRICAVADVFDALTCKRPYKPAFSNAKAFAILKSGRDTQFVPEVLDLFFEMEEQVVEIKRRQHATEQCALEATVAERGNGIGNETEVLGLA
jgi:putative two-component system response regulator